jgi:hypothetical protein
MRRLPFDSRLGRVRLIATACAGFLIAVLWMDLIFDVQVLRHRGPGDLPEDVLASIASYYRRATTTSRPMGHLIAVVMAILLGALLFHAFHGGSPAWVLICAALLAGAPILLALLRTVPNAVALGGRSGTPAEQSRLARAICLDHLCCAASVTAFLVLWLAPVA